MTSDPLFLVAVLGANGAGKTTLLKTACGALDSNKGRVLLEGEEIQCSDPDVVARMGIAHVPEGREVFPFLTVAENLAMGAYSRKNKDAIAKDIETVYGYFPALKELQNKMAAYLSGGQQQRVAIARALAGEPRILLADEPTGNLDSLMAQQVMELLESINDQGTTIVMVTHDADLARRAQRNIHVLDGKVDDYSAYQTLHGDSLPKEEIAATV